jgi:hypothetical protein
MIRRATQATRDGLAVRVPVTSLRRPTAGHELLELVEYLGLDPTRVDLIVEYGLISATDPSFSFICHRLPEINRWRTFTVLAGAFPPDLMDFRKPGQYEVQREEWSRWAEGANPSASIRYTSDTYWVIMRGEGLRTPGSAGHAPYPANAELLCGRKEFRGPQFSAGDAYIWRIGSREDPRTGSPETWIRAGINHHMTFAARQIPTIVAASG